MAKPLTRKEQILAGEDIKPLTREEQFLKKHVEQSGGGGSEPFVVTVDFRGSQYSKDKSFKEIVAATEHGLNVEAKLIDNNGTYSNVPLFAYIEKAAGWSEFVFITGEDPSFSGNLRLIGIIVRSTDTVSVATLSE